MNFITNLDFHVVQPCLHLLVYSKMPNNFQPLLALQHIGWELLLIRTAATFTGTQAA